MSSVTRFLLFVACASLLEVGCEAWNRNRRNKNDASISLGIVSGSDSRLLAVHIINGPDVIIGFPDNCAPDGLLLRGTHVIVSNNNGGPPPEVTTADADDAQSNVAIHCAVEDDGSRCSDGVSVTSYQFCGPSTTDEPISSSTSSAEPTSPTSSAESASVTWSAEPTSPTSSAESASVTSSAEAMSSTSSLEQPPQPSPSSSSSQASQSSSEDADEVRTGKTSEIF